ncbi:hypothetical protein D3C71_249830 [compost metagenome]
MTEFVPELGQAVFGQPHQEHAVPDIMLAALTMVSDELSRVMWNIHQETYDTPFSNTGNEFKNDVFHAVAYSWGDDEQPYNFAWKDLRISWYKRLIRGCSSNIPVTPDLAAQCLEECLASILRMEEEHERLQELQEAADEA